MRILNKIYNDYFKYLCDQVRLGKRNGYEQLMLSLFETDFIFLLADDENRVIDGMEERERFMYSNNNVKTVEKIFLQEDFPCSVMELMIGISKRMDNFIYSIDEGSKINKCFYTLLDNLNLSKFNDKNFDRISVDIILTNFVNRKYRPNGQGSLFPLKYPEKDMRNIPIYLQMTAFLNEHDYHLPKSLGYI